MPSTEVLGSDILLATMAHCQVAADWPSTVKRA